MYVVGVTWKKQVRQPEQMTGFEYRKLPIFLRKNIGQIKYIIGMVN